MCSSAHTYTTHLLAIVVPAYGEVFTDLSEPLSNIEDPSGRPRSRPHCALSLSEETRMSEDYRKASTASRRKSVAEEPVTSVLSANEVPVYDRELTADEEVLAALGYKYA